MAVRHQGREVIFDWASKSPDSIQWASFFSDCEHEVLEVTEGHRVTLTYNLFWAAYGPAAQGGRLNALDLKSTVFFSALQKLLDCPGFHPKGCYSRSLTYAECSALGSYCANSLTGGLLGFTCTHAYPHSSQLTLHKLHHTLKGIDMLVYQALMRLVGNARVSAVLDDSEYQDRIRDGGWDYDDSDGSQSDKGVVAHCTTRPPLTDWTGPPVTWADYEEGEPLDPESIDHSVRAHDRAPWKRELLYPRREVTWLNFAPTSQTPQELAVTFLTVCLPITALLHANRCISMETSLSWILIIHRLSLLRSCKGWSNWVRIFMGSKCVSGSLTRDDGLLYPINYLDRSD